MAVLFITGGCDGKQKKADSGTGTNAYHFPGETHLQNIKMLTDGGENAEAYLSFNEKMLIHQATPGEMKCDQQFVMNIDGYGKMMVSTGKGRTTCGYFLPGDTTVLYASTHLADENCPPPDMSEGYVWKLYDSYDIFLAGLDVFLCAYRSDEVALRGAVDYRWVKPEELAVFPFSAANHKFLDLIAGR